MDARFSVNSPKILWSIVSLTMFFICAGDSFAEEEKSPELLKAEAAAALQAAENLLRALEKKSELVDLQSAADEATLRATIAAQEKAEREAIFGATLAPREGTITATSNAEAMIFAQSRLAETAAVIASCVDNDVATVSVAATFPDVNVQMALQALPLLENEIDTIVKDIPTAIGNLREKSAVPGVVAPNFTDVVQSALSLVALARVNRNFAAVQITADNNAFVPTMIAALKNRRPKLPVNYGLFSGGESSFVAAFIELDRSVSTATSALASVALKAKELSDEVDSLSKEVKEAQETILNPPTQAAADAARNTLKQKTPELKNATENLTKFTKNIALPKAEVERLVKRASDYFGALEKGKIMGVDVLKLNEAGYIRDIFKKKGRNIILYVNVNNVAGTNLTRQTLLTNSLKVGAGVSVSYTMIGFPFQTLKSDTIYSYDGFYKVKDKTAGVIPSHKQMPPVISLPDSRRSTNRRVSTGPRSK